MLNFRPGRARRARHLAALGLTAAIGSTALAAPTDALLSTPSADAASADPVSRFLIDRGLIGAAPSATALAGRVRDKAAEMVFTAMNFIGVPYRRGGNSADSGFDCSGFTRQVFESSLGLLLPRRADEQAKAPGLVPIARDGLQPGDLVFFNTLKRTFSHVGIYIGDGKFIHSPRPGGEVRVEDMRFMYWAKRFTGARRAEAGAEPAVDATATAAASATLLTTRTPR